MSVRPSVYLSAVSYYNFFLMARQPLGGLGRLIVPRLHDHTWDTPQSVGLLWTKDQFVAEASTWQHTTIIRDRHPCPRRDSNPNPSKRAAADPRLSVATGIGIATLRTLINNYEFVSNTSRLGKHTLVSLSVSWTRQSTWRPVAGDHNLFNGALQRWGCPIIWVQHSIGIRGI
jgi:hypothetical protein